MVNRLLDAIDVSNTKMRDRTFDLMKLYAMLSVVLDHSLQHMIGPEAQYTQLYNWIFISQMPIFMFVSGYFAASGLNSDGSINVFLSKLVKTIISLFVPFVSYSLIISMLENKNLLVKSIINPNISLWFLWALMWMQIMMQMSQFIVKKAIKNENARMVGTVFLYFIFLTPIVLIYFRMPGYFDTKLVLYYSIYYLFGFIYSFFNDRLLFLNNSKFKSILIPVLLLLVCFVMAYHPTIIFDEENLVNLLSRIIGSICSILLVFNVFSTLVKYRFCEFLSSFGVLSLEMYYIHLLILRIPVFNTNEYNYLLFVMKYLLVILISIIVISILKSNSLTDLVVFGKISQKRKG